MGFNGLPQVGGEDPLVLQPESGKDLSQSPCETSWRSRKHLLSAGSICDGGLWKGG